MDELPPEFLELFGALPRQGPGLPEATRAVLELVPELPAAPRIIDAGCGSGASTLVLADALPRASILAVDVLDILLDRLGAALVDAGFEDRVEPRRTSMAAIVEPPASVDLIWSEGAIYTVGIEPALRHWRPLLRPGASVVFSQLCWWVPEGERPPALVEFFAREYPDLSDEAEVVALVESLGFACLATRRLAREGWLRDYYDPLARRCEALRPGASPAMAEIIAAAEAEIAAFAQNRGHDGYTFFVLRRRE